MALRGETLPVPSPHSDPEGCGERTLRHCGSAGCWAGMANGKDPRNTVVLTGNVSQQARHRAGKLLCFSSEATLSSRLLATKLPECLPSVHLHLTVPRTQVARLCVLGSFYVDVHIMVTTPTATTIIITT